MACVLVLNCFLLLLLNIFLTVSASRSPLPRYVVGDNVHYAIFGSSVFDPIKHIFEVNMTERLEGTEEKGSSTKSPVDESTKETLSTSMAGDESTKETLSTSKAGDESTKETLSTLMAEDESTKANFDNSENDIRKTFNILRVRNDTMDETDATTLETIVATVSSTNPETVNKMTNEANVVEPITKVKLFTPVDEDDSSSLKEQTNDNTITQTKIEPVEANKENISKEEPQDNEKKNDTKLLGQLARRMGGRSDYDSREVNEFPF